MTSLFDPSLDLLPRGIDVEASAYFPKFLQRLAASRDLFRRVGPVNGGFRLHELRYRLAIPCDDDLATILGLGNETR